MQPKPTPGPWAVFDTHPKKACFYIDRHDQIGEHAIGEVAVIYTTTDETKRANAALIAAAPDMFEALADCIVSLCAANLEHLPSYAKARAALAKAEGRDA